MIFLIAPVEVMDLTFPSSPKIWGEGSNEWLWNEWGLTKVQLFFSNDIFSSLSCIIFEWYWHIRSALWGLFNRIFRTQLSTRPRRCMFTNSFLFLFLQTTSVFLARRPLGPELSKFLKWHSPQKNQCTAQQSLEEKQENLWPVGPRHSCSLFRRNSNEQLTQARKPLLLFFFLPCCHFSK